MTLTPNATAKTAVVLIAHGTVESLDDLPEFLANIRRGHAAPPELVAEVRRRYEAIGGKSPLLDITYALAKKLETKLGMPVRVAMRLFRPYPKDVLADLEREGIERILVLPLAQFSAGIYGAAMKSSSIAIACAPNWGSHLTEAFASEIRPLVAAHPDAAVVFTAHSLPKSIVDAGDPYEKEVRASARAISEALGIEATVAFQSQGIGSGVAWLGPDLQATLQDLAKQGKKEIIVAPIGFLADHVEILYDLDIEAKAWAEELGVVLIRSASLNAKDTLVDALAKVAGLIQ